jgi:hypothetical protein
MMRKNSRVKLTNFTTMAIVLWWTVTPLSGTAWILANDTVLTIMMYSKHLFVPNFAGVHCGYAEVTEANKHLIESCYESR